MICPRSLSNLVAEMGLKLRLLKILGLLYSIQRSVLKPQMQGEEQSCFHSESKSQLCHLLAQDLGRVMRRQVNSTHLW